MNPFGHTINDPITRSFITLLRLGIYSLNQKVVDTYTYTDTFKESGFGNVKIKDLTPIVGDCDELIAKDRWGLKEGVHVTHS